MSQFLNRSYIQDELSTEVNFGDAVKLPTGGSTCDVYRARWQRRCVFVKILKEQFCYNPLYLEALEKEFDIGVNLKHPALPTYLEFHREYIVMEYIDGTTLADMIQTNDAWLKNEKHIVKLLSELVNVVDYLHRHNVTHCDIKPDNVMITTNGKNLMLIDFDKAYTDALNDTSGHPSRYGLTIEDIGKVAIDFHGIALVAEHLKDAGYDFSQYREFTKVCYEKDVNCEHLNEILSTSRISLPTKLSVIVAFALIILAGAIGLKNHLLDHRDMSNLLGSQPNENVQTIDSVTIVKEVSEESAVGAPIQSSRLIEDEEPRTQEEIHLDARKKADELDSRIQPYFNELQVGIDNLIKLRNDRTLTGQQLLDCVRAFGDKADEYINEAFATLNDMYPGLTDREAWRIMSYSKAYTGYTRRIAVEGPKLRLEYERRFELEGTTPQ